jgi:hypothetical protein
MYILVGRRLGEAVSCASTNCSAISVDRFEKQPPDRTPLVGLQTSIATAAWR